MGEEKREGKKGREKGKGSLWVHEALGDMPASIVSNSHFGKRLGARGMTFVAPLFFPMSPTIYFLIDEIFLSRAPGHVRS